MAEAAGILKWLRAMLPAAKPERPDAAASAAGDRAETERAEAERRGAAAPVYVPARRGAQPRRGGADGDAPR